jgi:hypothetical protein
MYKDIFVQKFYETMSSLGRVSCRGVFNVKNLFREISCGNVTNNSTGSGEAGCWEKS